MTPARRRLGWFAVAALLLHGWLPVVLGASLVAGQEGDRYSDRASLCLAAPAEPAARQPSPGSECPVTHDQICLCAIFASSLTPELGPSPAPSLASRGPRTRLPAPPPVPSLPVAPFEARAPPVFG